MDVPLAFADGRKRFGERGNPEWVEWQPMKRVARWMFNVLVGMSLLGCVAAAGIWGWS